MDAFARYSISALAALLAVGCNDSLPGFEGTTSLAVTLISPADPGSFENRLGDSDLDVTLSIEARDQDNQLDTSLSGPLDLYVHYLGSLTPKLEDGFPLLTVTMTDGVTGEVSVTLPQAYGPSYLWIEHSKGDNPTYATGTTEQLWYRNPYIADISRPLDEMALDALERSPLEEKQVNVTESRYGARGRRVVTGSYAQGYTVSDVQCADAAGTPPCVPGDYDHVFVFTFSRPEDVEGGSLKRGQVVELVTGAISEFNGLTEVNFPRTELAQPEPDLSLVPEPIVIDPDWLLTRIEMERVEAALIAADDAVVCPLDDDFDTYKQWKLDIGQGCGTPLNVISAGDAPDFDPADYVGETLPRVVGTLRPVNIGSFHVWIMYPRDADDIVTP